MLSHSTQAEIHAIWDALVDIPASEEAYALRFLIGSISELIDADHGYWMSVSRSSNHLNEPEVSDCLYGPVHYFRDLAIDPSLYPKVQSTFNFDAVQTQFLKLTPTTSSFNAVCLSQLSLSHGNNEASSLLNAREIVDSVFVSTQIDESTEVIFGFNRLHGGILFEACDVELVSYALRSLKWFHHHVLLGYGFLRAEQPLTQTERRVLKALLTDLSEKQIAEKLDQKVDTTHKHVKAIYRKFNVSSRAGLMAIWLGNK